MTRAELEHIVRAAAVIADDDEIIVIGSQAILGQFPAAPAALLVSNEADVIPRNHPERWEAIDGSIGELSPFHETFGYYAQGVELGTATLPSGWQERWIPISTPATRGAVGLCLEVHDLLISKYVAGRDKDRVYGQAAARHGLASSAELRARLAVTELDPQRRALVTQLIAVDFAGS